MNKTIVVSGKPMNIDLLYGAFTGSLVNGLAHHGSDIDKVFLFLPSPDPYDMEFVFAEDWQYTPLTNCLEKARIGILHHILTLYTPDEHVICQDDRWSIVSQYKECFLSKNIRNEIEAQQFSLLSEENLLEYNKISVRVIRFLRMYQEILKNKQVQVVRSDRDELLNLLFYADKKTLNEVIDREWVKVFKLELRSSLPDSPPQNLVPTIINHLTNHGIMA